MPLRVTGITPNATLGQLGAGTPDWTNPNNVFGAGNATCVLDISKSSSGVAYDMTTALNAAIPVVGTPIVAVKYNLGGVQVSGTGLVLADSDPANFDFFRGYSSANASTPWTAFSSNEAMTVRGITEGPQNLVMSSSGQAAGGWTLVAAGSNGNNPVRESIVTTFMAANFVNSTVSSGNITLSVDSLTIDVDYVPLPTGTTASISQADAVALVSAAAESWASGATLLDLTSTIANVNTIGGSVASAIDDGTTGNTRFYSHWISNQFNAGRMTSAGIATGRSPSELFFYARLNARCTYGAGDGSAAHHVTDGWKLHVKITDLAGTQLLAPSAQKYDGDTYLYPFGGASNNPRKIPIVVDVSALTMAQLDAGFKIHVATEIINDGNGDHFEDDPITTKLLFDGLDTITLTHTATVVSPVGSSTARHRKTRLSHARNVAVAVANDDGKTDIVDLLSGAAAG